jgi:hypothetical protein
MSAGEEMDVDSKWKKQQRRKAALQRLGAPKRSKRFLYGGGPKKKVRPVGHKAQMMQHARGTGRR